MKQEYSDLRDNMVKGHGKYTEITEQEFLKSVTGSQNVICHFYHNDFQRCKIVDMHLRKIAAEHTEAKFIYLNAEKSPFFIQKLAIKVLPTIIIFIDGIAFDRVVGFEDLGMSDDFPTINLTRRLVRTGALKPLNKAEAGRLTMNKAKKDDSESDEDYWIQN